MENVMSVERAIIENYTTAGLYDRMVEVMGDGPVTLEGLSVVDNLHVGGRAATRYLMENMNLTPGMSVLDVGSGLGGPARQIAHGAQVNVTGIDLTPDFCAIATRFTAQLNMQEQVHFHIGTALAMEFADQSFDAAYTIHTAMNIEDKATLYKEVYRVLKPGAQFAIYDITRGDDPREPDFPLPWSGVPETSFLASVKEMVAFLEKSGFEVTLLEDRKQFAAAALERGLAEGKSGAGPRIRGGDFAVRVANLAAAVADSRCAVWQIICTKPA
jgi:ubiquinone/menaquinone biosynthesis C-methylase UbiE